LSIYESIMVREYTPHGNKLNFSNEDGGQEKDLAHPT
jgi:hypothetical protein